VQHSIQSLFFSTFAFVLGAAVGSFLNVCIYRWPADLSINRPRRSFCPQCKQPIPWHHNLPLISWLALGGRCAHCGAKISFRYFAVELVTAALFFAIWQRFPWQVAIAYWIFVSFLIIGTFIDFEHFIIPDRVTIGGTIAGVVCSVVVPALMQTNSRLAAGIRAGLAAALGYVILWIVLEAGKIAFGRKRIEFDAPVKRADAWLLDLGDVREAARVSLNGREVGHAWSLPFALRLPALRTKGNVLEIEVTNLPANRIRDLDLRKVDWKVMKEINLVDLRYKPFDASGWPVAPSGLLGPVRLVPLEVVRPR